MTDWPKGALDYVQSIADTKLLLSHRYAQWMLSGPSLEDDIAGASAAQDELGHVRQLFALLGEQGRDDEWLEGDRGPSEYANASPLDTEPPDWTTFVATVGPIERATWYRIDALDHEDFSGLGTRIGQDEFFHLEFLDGRLATLADADPDAVRSALESVFPGLLAYLGPPDYDEDADPLVAAEFTDRSVATLRSSLREEYEEILSGTPVSLEDVAVDWNEPTPETWNETRRRVDGGGISEKDATSLSGVRSEQFAVD